MVRVFPRKTNATPDDDNSFIGAPPMTAMCKKFFIEPIEIHVSCTFTYDKPEAERLADLWSEYGDVKLGGPAYDHPGERFTPGLYLKKGYVITSRGCPNNCWF